MFLIWNFNNYTLPQPTQDQIALIQKLGNDSFDIREKAYNDLKKLDIKALRSMEIYGLNNPDLEIHRRSEFLIDEFYEIDDKLIPSCIQFFANRRPVKLTNGEFIIPVGSAKFWFEAAGGNNQYPEFDDAETLKTGQGILGTKLFIDQLRRAGYSKGDINLILDHIRNDNRHIPWTYMYGYDEESFPSDY